MSAKGEGKKLGGEITSYTIVEKEYEVEIPKYVEVEVERPVFVEKIYEVPVVTEVMVEKPIVVEKDITYGLREFIQREIEKCIADVVSHLKFHLEIPVSRVISVAQQKRE